jgi:hypothetical protein
VPDIVSAIYRAFSLATANTFVFGIGAALVAALMVSLLREAPMRSAAGIPSAQRVDLRPTAEPGE